mgnify:CR=1 FL=1
MGLRQFDFSSFKQADVKTLVPVVLCVGKAAYEVAKEQKNVLNAWNVANRILYHTIADEDGSFFDRNRFVQCPIRGVSAFAKDNSAFGNNTATHENTLIKISDSLYMRVFLKAEERDRNFLVMKEVLAKWGVGHVSLFVCEQEEIGGKNFQKELGKMKQSLKRKGYSWRSGPYVSSLISDRVLFDSEKLVLKIRREFEKKLLIGDVVLNKDEEKLLNALMIDELRAFRKYGGNATFYGISDKRVFATGLVRYAMHQYNRKGTAEFWPYFKEQFGMTFDPNWQDRLHECFREIMELYGKPYSRTAPTKIDNITMHCFVCDNSAFQLFDYLFDFWRRDLARNVDRLKDKEAEGEFNNLIEAMKQGEQSIRSHTSLLLSFPETTPLVKNRIRRILRLMDKRFWENEEIPATGNRINALLDQWTRQKGGSFQKERSYSPKKGGKRGSLYCPHPALHLDFGRDVLQLVLPFQRLFDASEKDEPTWAITSAKDGWSKEVKADLKRDKISFYVDAKLADIPMSLGLSSFEISLQYSQSKKFSIGGSHIRFFGEEGDYINHKVSIVPAEPLIALSDSPNYPTIFGGTETSNCLEAGLYRRDMNPEKGEILLLDGEYALSIGEKLQFGLRDADPVPDAKVEWTKGEECEIYARAPKLLLRAEDRDMYGIGITVNGVMNRVPRNSLQRLKFENEISTCGVVLDLAPYIQGNGIYSLSVSLPSPRGICFEGKIAYFKGFGFSFLDSPYLFKSEGAIRLEPPVSNKTAKEEDERSSWIRSSGGQSDDFCFDFDPMQSEDAACRFVEEGRLKLDIQFGDKYYPCFFAIPALFWKMGQEGEWNVERPDEIPLRSLKNKKMYVKGPFVFSDCFLYTDEDIDVAEQEVKVYPNAKSSGELVFFDLTNVYEWFRGNYEKPLCHVNLHIADKNIPFMDVVCRGTLIAIQLTGDAEENKILLHAEIKGIGNYVATVSREGIPLCEDEPLNHGVCEIYSEPKAGTYHVSISELVEDDDEDEFESEEIAIPLGEKDVPLINLFALDGATIKIKGLQDIDKKTSPRKFGAEFFVQNLTKVNSSAFGRDQFIGLWCDDHEDVSSFILYQGLLVERSLIASNICVKYPVLAAFFDPKNPDSFFLFKDNGEEEFDDLIFNKCTRRLISNEESANLAKNEKRCCCVIGDNFFIYLTDIFPGKE